MLEKLHKFKRYQTRDEYSAITQKSCPPWNAYKPPKYWEDPSALLSTKRSVIYDVLAYGALGTQPAVGADGKPMLDIIALSKEDAAVVNIPPQGSNIPGADVPEIPVPLRALETFEQLYFTGPMGLVDVRDTRKAQPASLEEIQRLVQAMAAKQGIL